MRGEVNALVSDLLLSKGVMVRCAVRYPVGWCAHVFIYVSYCIVCVRLDKVDMLCSLVRCAGGVFRGDVQRFGARCS